MKYRLQVNISEQDYLDFNLFWMLRSPYGKKQRNSVKITIVIIAFVFIALAFLTLEMTVAIVFSVLLLCVFAVFLFLFPRYYKKTLQKQFKSIKKSGKMAYTPSAVLEFYDDYYVEIDPEKRIQQNYTAIERISLADHVMIYLHTNNVGAVLLPVRSFSSKEEYDSFMAFISSKCTKIDTYQ